MADVANETEVRDRFCGEIYSHYKITFRLERGRSDARRNRVIMEFKDKGLFHGRSNSAKFSEALSQLTNKYIPQQARNEGASLCDYVGVAIDGEHYAFVFVEENGTHRHTALMGIDADSVYPLLSTIILDRRRAFSVENLLADFGSNSSIARGVLKQLSEHLSISLDQKIGSPKVRMLFQEWQKLFSQATSLGRIGQTRIDDYFLSIGLLPPFNYTKELFTLHTYNALLFKLLAGEVLATIRFTDYSGFASEAAGSSLPKLRMLLDRRIEHAELFVNNRVENFIEGTFFSWYIENAPDSLLESLKEVLVRLGLYVFPTTMQPRIRDIVKAIYQDLVPDALRKNIGEFYTPEWLVEFVLNEAGYLDQEILGRRLLDPCCGSGNFLIHAIARYKESATRAGQDAQHMVTNILQNIVGFDLNPLAVLAARLNYLLAILDILPTAARVEIPVYLADAVYAPVRDENNAHPLRSYKIGTVLGEIDLVLPEELVQQRQLFGLALSIMEQHIETDESRENFLLHLHQDQNLHITLSTHHDWIEHLGNMFDSVQGMERQNWNRIWCRIVRNYFSSVAVGKANYIIGNPPWVRWSELPADYRNRIKPTCDKYNIFSKTPYFGGNELDISGMIAYTVTDKWLAPGGILAFVITQIHFQAPSSEGFRRFQLPDGTNLGVFVVHDFKNFRAFPRLANKPAVFTWRKGSRTTFPITYNIWLKVKNGGAVQEDAPWHQVVKLLERIELKAVPLPPDQRWSILSPKEMPLAVKLQGGSSIWRGRKGITTDLNGAYFVRIIGAGAMPGLIRIRTQPQGGRQPVPLLVHDIEDSLVFPLLKGGRQIRAFHFDPIDLAVIVPNITITSVPSQDYFRREYPEAYRYFRRINKSGNAKGIPILEARSTWQIRMRPMGMPFYAIYNVGNYTFSRYKVAWAEMARDMAAAVVSTQELPFGMGDKPIVPDHKIYFVATDDCDHAHFLCSMINSIPVKSFINSFTIKIQVGSLFRHLRLPAYDKNNIHHKKLSLLSRVAHKRGINDSLQTRIDREAEIVIMSM